MYPLSSHKPPSRSTIHVACSHSNHGPGLVQDWSRTLVTIVHVSVLQTVHTTCVYHGRHTQIVCVCRSARRRLSVFSVYACYTDSVAVSDAKTACVSCTGYTDYLCILHGIQRLSVYPAWDTLTFSASCTGYTNLLCILHGVQRFSVYHARIARHIICEIHISVKCNRNSQSISAVLIIHTYLHVSPCTVTHILLHRQVRWWPVGHHSPKFCQTIRIARLLAVNVHR